ncbi:hypothetical protein OIU84_019752, partial [Salix udensis]
MGRGLITTTQNHTIDNEPVQLKMNPGSRLKKLFSFDGKTFHDCKIVNIEAVVAVVKEGKSDGQALACFLGEIWCRSSFDHVITLTIIQGNYLITSMK